jgi:hypothetical protein
MSISEPHWRGRPSSLGTRLLPAAALCGVLGSAIPTAAEPFPYTSFTKVGSEYRLTLPTDPTFYYGFQHSSDLKRLFAMRQMALGGSRPDLRLHARCG